MTQTEVKPTEVKPAKHNSQTAPAPRTKARGLSRFRVLPLLDSYLVWSVFGASLRGLGWFAGLFLAFALISSARSVAQKGLPILLALEGIALQMPRILLFTIPASLLFGAVSTFTEMSAKGEITAMGAGGMSVKRMMRAPMCLAIVSAILAFWMQETLVPGAELRKNNVVERAVSQVKIIEGFKLVTPRDDGTIESVIQADSFDPKTKTLLSPSVQLYGNDRSIAQEIKAQRAFFDEKAGKLVFQNGFLRYSDPSKRASQPGFSPSIPGEFSKFALEIRVDKAKLTGARGAREQILKKNFEMVSWQQLQQFRAEQTALLDKGIQGKAREEAVEWVQILTFGIHDKFSTPLAVLAMVLIGAPLGIRPQRSASPGIAMGLSLMVMLGYYIFWTICTQVGKGGVSIAAFLAYLPFLTLAGTGLYLLKRHS